MPLSPEERDARLRELQDEYGISEEHAEEIRDLLGPKSLRDQNKELAAQAKEMPDLKSKLAKYENADKVREAFEKQGLDWEALEDSPLVKESVENFAEFEDEEKVAAFIERYKLPTVESSEGDEKGEESGARQVVTQAQRAARDGGHSKTTIGSKDIAEWSPDKIAKFRTDHPELYEQVLQGEQVVAPV